MSQLNVTVAPRDPQMQELHRTIDAQRKMITRLKGSLALEAMSTFVLVASAVYYWTNNVPNVEVPILVYILLIGQFLYGALYTYRWATSE